MIIENIHNHLGLFFVPKLNLFDHINEKIKKATKAINFEPVVTNFFSADNFSFQKSFVRPHLDYSDVIYDQPNNFRLSDKTVQYNAALAIAGTARRISKEKLYQELGL